MTARPTAGQMRREPSRLLATAALAALFVALLLVGSAVSPYLFRVSTLRSELAEQLRLTLGLNLARGEKARFDLLPTPHVVMKDLRIDDPTGTLALDAETLDGEVRLLPLIVGRVELTAVTLTRPHLVIDLGGRPMQPDSAVGRAVRLRDVPDGGVHGDRDDRLGAVTLVDGSAVLKSSGLARPPTFEHIDMTVDWRNLASAATVSGRFDISGTPTEASLWLAQPSRLIRGERSAMTLNIHSAPLDLTANGDLSGNKAASFRGRISASAPDLATLLDRLDIGTTLPAPFLNFHLESDAAINLTEVRHPSDGRATLDLPNLRVHADGNDYEGTLAYEGGQSRTLSGTLAIDQLNLAPFMGAAPRIGPDEAPWSSTPFRRIALAHAMAPIGLDLRISAAHVRAGSLSLDDAALAVMTRDTRTEVGLLEAKAYGGTLRGRMSFGGTDEGIDLRAAGTLAGADAATLGWDLFGRQIATGTVGGSVNLEGSGASTAAFMSSLHGSARLNAADGEISGVDVLHGLAGVARGVGSPLAAMDGGRTPYSTALLDVRIADGVATLTTAAIVSPQTTVVATGSADLAKAILDLHASAGATGAAATSSSLRFALHGRFGKVVVTREAEPSR